MYCVYGNNSWYINGGLLFRGGSLLGGSAIGDSTVVDCIHYVFKFKCSVGKIMHKEKQRCRIGLDDFMSVGGHLLVPFLFHEVTSLHPLHFREMIFPLVKRIYSQQSF